MTYIAFNSKVLRVLLKFCTCIATNRTLLPRCTCIGLFLKCKQCIAKHKVIFGLVSNFYTDSHIPHLQWHEDSLEMELT